MKLQKLRVMSDALYYESQGKKPYCFFPAKTLDGADYYLCKCFDEKARIARTLTSGADVSVVGNEERDPETNKKFFMITYLETEGMRPKPSPVKVAEDAPTHDYLFFEGAWKKKIDLLIDFLGTQKAHADLKKFISDPLKAPLLVQNSNGWAGAFKVWKEIMLFEVLFEMGLEVGEDRTIRAIRKPSTPSSGEGVSIDNREEKGSETVEAPRTVDP